MKVQHQSSTQAATTIAMVLRTTYRCRTEGEPVSSEITKFDKILATNQVRLYNFVKALRS